MNSKALRSSGSQRDGSFAENGSLSQDYDKMAIDLLTWIEEKISLLSGRDFANTLPEVQQQLADFNQYRRQEKPPKFAMKGKLESQLYSAKSEASCPNGQDILSINMAWGKLEKCEHDIEIALRRELKRLEKLELLAITFDKKYTMRESWLNQNKSVVSKENFSASLVDVEASTKKLSALETYVMSYEGRIDSIVSMAGELERENFHDSERIQLCKGRIVRLWGGLQDLIKKTRARLERYTQLRTILQDISNTIDRMNEIKVALLSEDYSKNYVQESSVVEGEITTQAHRVHVLKSKAGKFLNLGEGDELRVNEDQVRQQMTELDRVFNELVHLSDARHIKQDASHTENPE